MMLSRIFIIVLWLFLYSPTYGMARFCSYSLQAIGKDPKSFSQDGKYQILVQPAVVLAKGVLGALWSKENDVEVSLQKCLIKGGCCYCPFWNVVQIDEGLFKENREALGAVLIHELAHSVQYNLKPEYKQIQKALLGLKRNHLAGWYRSHKKRQEILSAREKGMVWELWYWILGSERKLNMREIALVDEQEDAFKKASGSSLILESSPKTDPKVFLERSLEELFADLVSCSAYADGNAIAKALKIMIGEDFPQRENEKKGSVPESDEWFKIGNEHIHHFFAPARRWIWEHYLKGKTPSEVSKILVALSKQTREWPETAVSLRRSDKEGNVSFNQKSMNLLMINSFEAHFLNQ